MFKRKMVATMALVTALGMGLSACGENGGTEDTGTGQDTGVTDTGGGDMDTGGPGEDGGPGDDTGGTTGDTGEMADGGGADGGGGEMGSGFVKDEFLVEKEENCDNNPELERCKAEPGDVTWGPSSVLTSLELSSTEAQSCCFDMTDDGRDGPNNALGGILTSLAGVTGGNIDVSVAESIEADSLILLMEHEGLDALKSSADFNVNFFLGVPNTESDGDFVTKKDSSCKWADNPQKGCETVATAGKEFQIDPQSFSTKAFAQARLPNAKIDENGVLTAGPGKVGLQLDVDQLGTLSLAINGAKIEGKVTDDSELEGKGVGISGGQEITVGGTTLEKAKLGGYVKARELINLLNSLLSDCGCLGNPSAAIEVPNQDASDPDLCPPENPECADELSCTMEVQGKTGSCGSDSGSICENSGNICGLGVGLITGALDLDIDRDGQFDAISIGALIEATGGKIVGVEAMGNN